ncbi:alpha/beta fold hydrolase [Desulfogranum japonicum]|uniref:alpha/beta fold hydrolase n=1 Tax=Desulfogranum japonicum TaxID=231447 RepID=UPI0004058188|nr:alpha/beta hydrolase [Desulfogranum japonicum]
MDNTSHAVVANTARGPIQYCERKENHSDIQGAILTIHGAMGGYEQSDILGQAIGPKGYRYIAVSRPGYLQTPLKGKESPEEQADLLAALMDELGIQQAVVMAISGGGYSALHFSLRHPERCRALILCSTTGSKNDVPVPFAFTVMKVMARVPLLVNLMRNRFLKNVEKSVKRSVSYPDIAQNLINDEQLMTYYTDLTISTMSHMGKRIPGTVNDIHITQNTEYPLEEIIVPTLVIHGSDDPVVPFAKHGKKLAERIPGAQLCLAERGEHMAIFTHNQQVRNAVSGFLDSLP